MDQDGIELLLSHADDPLGLVGGFGDDGPYYPFAAPGGETASPVIGDSDEPLPEDRF